MSKCEVSTINSSTLHQLWCVIEQTQPRVLLELNDTELVKQLLTQIKSKQRLSDEETHMVGTYLRSKTSLIRDIAGNDLLNR